MTRREQIRRTADYIAGVQCQDGAIPWFEGGIVDPWDHVEAAMGLSVGGYVIEAATAYDWLAAHQTDAGYWLAAYQDNRIADGTRAETNFVAYVATGVWHHYLITGDLEFLERLWPTVTAALDFVAGLQSPHGEIYWALDTRFGINKDALVTGCCSIYRSFECGIRIADALDLPSAQWVRARERLGHALREQPERFDRTWASKSRYSMDWFYPILGGLVSGRDARARLTARWQEFVEPELGCRCVADQPWVTIAESCELTMACLGAGEVERARRLFASLARFQVEDGSWWTGYAFADEVMWPDERPTWTAGAVLLALDALEQITPASSLFTRAQPLPASSNAAQYAQRAG